MTGVRPSDSPVDGADGRGLFVRPAGHGLPGRLIVLEGIDGSGRSTHARLLEDVLRYRGRGVTRTSLATSVLSAEPIRRAKRDRASGPVATTLLYAADLAERMEQLILPALRAGLVVLADRYAYTPMARAEARGLDRAWVEKLFSFVVPADLVLFLDVDPATILQRRPLQPTVDPYEAGADLRLSADVLEGYRLFQDRLYRCFSRYVERYGLRRVPAAGTIHQVERGLERAALALIEAQATRRPVSVRSKAASVRATPAGSDPGPASVRPKAIGSDPGQTDRSARVVE
ncbi:MAG TPA: hypothetical protein VNF73_05625 [Candidatus Saccharimonadales bacterium]|nr:hypothetical protein [Candidatus Saccharimonadales bacterium]